MTMDVLKTKWFMPLFSAALGAACLAAFWIGGNPDEGLRALGVMVALGTILLLGGRSETIRGLRGDGRDERFARIDLVATAIAGNALIGLVIAMFLWEWAHGRSGTPYVQLGAVTGVAYILAIGFLRWRG
jgi:hypothetical protein